jgi:hypothetical protein
MNDKCVRCSGVLQSWNKWFYRCQDCALLQKPEGKALVDVEW